MSNITATPTTNGLPGSGIPVPPAVASLLAAHGQDFLGPNFLSLFFQAIETGVIISQFIVWCSWQGEKERESWVLRVLVGFVFVVAILQTCLTVSTTWTTYVKEYGNWIAALSFQWVDKAMPLLTTAMAAPVQGFLIWRCWMVMERRWTVIAVLGTLLLTSIISSFLGTIDVLKYKFESSWTSYNGTSGPPPPPPAYAFILMLVSAAVLDILITAILLIYLTRARSQIFSKRFRKTIRGLDRLIWESAVPPCLCAILTVIIYLKLGHLNYWDLMFHAVLGKLYVMSLFITLNGRAKLAAEHMSPRNDRLTSMIHVDITAAQSSGSGSGLTTPSALENGQSQSSILGVDGNASRPCRGDSAVKKGPERVHGDGVESGAREGRGLLSVPNDIARR